jgi:EpsI family protein
VPLGSRQIGFVCLGLLLLAVGPIARTFAVQSNASIIRGPLPSFSNCASLRGWSADWLPVFVSPDYSISDSYQCDGYRLHVNIVQYAEQHQGKEAVGEFNSVIPRAWWNATSRGRQRVTANLEVDEYRVQRTPMRLTIWNWYLVGVQPASSELTTKAMEAFNALRLRPSTTTNITIAVEADPEFDAAKVLRVDVMDVLQWFQTEMRSTG